MDYLDELSSWVKKKQTKTNNATLFLAQKDKIAAALAAGYPMKTVWEHLHEKNEIPYTYATFRRHVAQFIPDKKPSNAKNEVHNPQPDNQDTSPTKPVKTKQFSFNPVPKKEDLI